MSSIITGGTANVKSQTITCMAINSSGQEISTGTQIMANSQAVVESNVLYVLAVDSNGNALK